MNTLIVRCGVAAVAVLCALGALTACGAVGKDPKSGRTVVPLPSATSSQQPVAEENFVHLWPFTVDKGTLECRKGQDAIFVAPDGKKYTLNDQATHDGYADVGPIHNSDVSLGAVRSQALSLCGK